MLLNNISIRSVGALGSLLAISAMAGAVPLPPQKGPGPDPVEQGRKLLAGRSARFVENKGQWKAEARFLAQNRNLNLWYTDRGIRIDQMSPDLRRHQAVDLFFVGGKVSRPHGVSKLNSENQYYRGNLSVRGVGSYHEILKRDVVPGVDMRAYFDAGKPRYDLIVAPGVKPSSIALGFKGSNGLSVAKGALKVGTNFGGIFNGKPVAYQTIAGKRVPVAAAWTVAQGTARFRLGSYDVSRPLVIDPLVYGTYFGGIRGPDEIRAAVTDLYGGVNRGLFITGSSSAPDYPGTSLPFTGTLNPQGTDAFVARIPTAGTYTDLSIFLGGTGFDVAQYVKQNPYTGDLWIAGTTVAPGTRNSTTNQFSNFPATTTNTTTGSRLIIGDDVAQGSNFFVGRFTHLSDGSLSFGEDGTGASRYAVVLGSGITRASTGSAYISGFDMSSKTDNSIQFAFSGVSDSALAPTSNALISNSGTNNGTATDGYRQPGHRAGFLLRFAVSTAVAPTSAFSVSQVSSQYVEGTRSSELRGVALDSVGQAYVVGTVYTGSPANVDTSQSPATFYTTANAIADTNGTTVIGRLLRATDVFVRIYGTYGTASGQSAINFSGLYGGNGDDEAGGVAASLSTVGGSSAIPIYTGSAIAIDADANIYFTGTTLQSFNFPYTQGAFFHFQPPAGAETRNTDVFVARLSTGGTRLDYSTNLHAFAGVTSLGYGPAQFTTAMPAGIAVDGRGYVYVTGNLRPYAVNFPTTYTTAGTVNEPTGHTNSSIANDIIAAGTNTIAATTSGTPAGTEYDDPSTSTSSFPTTEGFLVVLNPSFSGIQFASYIGGKLDDLVFAPTFDSSGNVMVMGWTDGSRTYTAPFYTGGSPEYDQADGGVPGYIGGNAVKSIPDTNGFLQIGDFGYNSWRTDASANAFDQQTATFFVGRDGYVASVGVNLPTAVPPTISISFNPSTIPALGTSTGTVTLNAAQPLKTTVRIVLNSLIGLTSKDITLNGPNDPPGQLTNIVIPSGSTTGTFTVKSNTVGSGGSATFSASIPSGTSTSTSSATLNISGLSFSLAVNPMIVVGSSSGTSVTGTITLGSAAPTGLSFLVTVPYDSTSKTIFGIGTSTPFATIDSTDPTKLDIATATIAAGSSSGTFTFKVGSPSAPSVLTITATTVDSSGVVAPRSASTSLTVNPVGLVSISPAKSTIRSGRDQLVLNVVFNGPVSSSDALALTYGLGGVFPPSTSSNPTVNTTVGALTYVSTSNGQYTYRYTANSNRISRSQDVSILATFKGTTASTTVTVVR